MMQYPVLNQMKAWSYCMTMAKEGFSPVQLSGWSRPVNNSRPLERLPSVILLVLVSFNSIMIRIFSNIAHWEAIEVTTYRGSVLYQHWGTSISNIRAWKANISNGSRNLSKELFEFLYFFNDILPFRILHRKILVLSIVKKSWISVIFFPDDHCTQLVKNGITEELLNLLRRHPVTDGNIVLHHAIFGALRNLAIPGYKQAFISQFIIIYVVAEGLEVLCYK